MKIEANDLRSNINLWRGEKDPEDCEGKLVYIRWN